MDATSFVGLAKYGQV
ncbi:MAG: hypothetical protein L0K26_10490, partial [Enterococcaceae bacterium]|nr:hypothetical protein [Enterococcaceae bacterium]